MIVRSAEKSVSNTFAKPSWRRPATSLPVTGAPGLKPYSCPTATRTAGAVCTMTVFVASCRTLQTSATLLLPTIAPVGQTLAHWPQNVQEESASGIIEAVPTFAEKPRPLPVSAPTVWTLLHTVSQRRHMTHFDMSRTSAGDSSISSVFTAPLYLMSRMPNSCASFCSSQCWFFVHVRHVCGWSERRSSRTVRRALSARSEFVQTSTPSRETGVAQAGTRILRGPRMPVASTRHRRQDAGLFAVPHPTSGQ